MAATSPASSPASSPSARALPWLGLLARPFRQLLRAGELWRGADGVHMAAAMSFYGVLSLAPLVVVMVALLGWWIDRQVLEQALISQIGGLVGEQGASVIRAALDSAQRPAEGLLASLIGFGVLLFGATGVFSELQEALARLWAFGRGSPPRQGWWYTASVRLRGVAYVLAFGFLLLVSLVLATVLKIFSGWAGHWIALELLLRLFNELLGFGICAGLFLALMRMSVGPKPPSRYLVFGAFIGALLFTLGRQLLTLYLSTAAIVSAYGAAGSLVVLLMWIYFSSGVLLFAASCARAMEESRRPAT